MKLFNMSTNNPKDIEKTQVYSTFKSRSELILDQIHTLPLHFKLVIYACIRLLSQDENNGKVTLTEVYVEYRKLADELNITSPCMSRINELARELETLGFLVPIPANVMGEWDMSGSLNLLKCQNTLPY